MQNNVKNDHNHAPEGKELDCRGMYDTWEKMRIAGIFVGQTRGKRPLWGPSRKRDDGIRMELK